MSEIQSIVIVAAVVLAGVSKGLSLLGWNPFVKHHRTSSDMLAELEFKDRQISHLELEKHALERERSLVPVLDALEKNAQLQSKVLDRLAHHNGSFAHMEQAMGHIEESLRLIVGYIVASVHTKE